jgi:hypothetical protein
MGETTGPAKVDEQAARLQTISAQLTQLPNKTRWFTRNDWQELYGEIETAADAYISTLVTDSIDHYLNSKSRIGTRPGLGSLKEHVLARWNSKGRPGSPQGFYGVRLASSSRRRRPATYRWTLNGEGSGEHCT